MRLYKSFNESVFVAFLLCTEFMFPFTSLKFSLCSNQKIVFFIFKIVRYEFFYDKEKEIKSICLSSLVEIYFDNIGWSLGRFLLQVLRPPLDLPFLIPRKGNYTIMRYQKKRALVIFCLLFFWYLVYSHLYDPNLFFWI